MLPLIGDNMKRYLLAALLCLVPGIAHAGDYLKEIVEPTVQLNYNCSGTIIRSTRDDETGKVSTYVLTAKHCTANTGDPGYVQMFEFDKRWKRIEERRIFSNVFGQYYKHDLAIIKLKDEERLFKNVAKIAPADFIPGLFQQVKVVGYPLALAKVVSDDGSFVETMDFSFRGMDGEKEFQVFDAHVAGGNSGGGIFAEIDGEWQLIGVTSMGASVFPYTLGVPTKVVNEYVDVALKGK